MKRPTSRGKALVRAGQWAVAGALLCVCPAAALAQAAAAAPQASTAPAPGAAAPPAVVGVTPPEGYLIGPEDVLSILFWREKDLSADVVVRPDGKISLPLINEVHAAGLTPEQLRQAVMEAASKYVEEPNATISIKAINSRRIYITGQVAKPGTYPLGGPTTVLQFLATAGGVLEWADSDKIVVVRTENGRTQTFRFNYEDVLQGKNLRQNIELKPGDTVLVP